MSAAKPHAGWPVLSSYAPTSPSLLDQPPHPYELLAERAKGICLLTRLWAQSDVAHAGVRPSAR